MSMVRMHQGSHRIGATRGIMSARRCQRHPRCASMAGEAYCVCQGCCASMQHEAFCICICIKATQGALRASAHACGLGVCVDAAQAVLHARNASRPREASCMHVDSARGLLRVR